MHGVHLYLWAAAQAPRLRSRLQTRPNRKVDIWNINRSWRWTEILHKVVHVATRLMTTIEHFLLSVQVEILKTGLLFDDRGGDLNSTQLKFNKNGIAWKAKRDTAIK